MSDALTAGALLECVFVEVGATADPQLARLVTNAEAAGAAAWELPVGSLAKIAAVTAAQGMVAVARRPAFDEVALTAPQRSALVLVLVGVADPGNAGTLLRAAEASGASTVVFCDGAVDPTNPKCVRASAGALFHVPVLVADDAIATLRRLGAAGFRRLATVPSGGCPYDEFDTSAPLAVVLGNEAHGLAQSVMDEIDEVVSIPMVGRSESLNVAMAGAVICFEALRRRRAAGEEQR